MPIYGINDETRAALNRALIAGKPVGQQVRIGGDIGFEEGPQLGPGRGRQHGDARIAGEDAMMPKSEACSIGTSTQTTVQSAPLSMWSASMFE
jgi:hypothetical protein